LKSEDQTNNKKMDITTGTHVMMKMRFGTMPRGDMTDWKYECCGLMKALGIFHNYR